MVEPVTTLAAAKVLFDAAKFATTAMAKAIGSMYGAAKGLDAFVDRHIDELKGSPDEAVNRIGRVLEGAKKGLYLGYAAPVILIATGQLLLGNPLSATKTVLTAATLTNPIASTCAAIGAIYFGWKALNKSEQQAIISFLCQGFALTGEVIREILDFALKMLHDVLGRKEVQGLKTLLADFAGKLGRSIYSVTGRLIDLVYSEPDVTSDVLAQRPLRPVLSAMSEAELNGLLVKVLKVDEDKLKQLGRDDRNRLCEMELREAASYSLPAAKLPVYDDIVRIVARRLKLPHRAAIPTEDVEKAILFKVMERSLEGLDAKQKDQLALQVQQTLRERGIDRQVTFDEVVKFVKFAGMDVGGSFGTLLMTAPGTAGVLGLNVLQLIVLQGIIATSGYAAGLGAVLGFGTGGAMLALAGAAGPVGLALGVLFTAYSLSGPAFRKLIPAICVIAAKRVEIEGSEFST
jgi:uncharacterized protein YaaW (UPF0174 family)